MPLLLVRPCRTLTWCTWPSTTTTTTTTTTGETEAAKKQKAMKNGRSLTYNKGGTKIATGFSFR